MGGGRQGPKALGHHAWSAVVLYEAEALSATAQQQACLPSTKLQAANRSMALPAQLDCSVCISVSAGLRQVAATDLQV
jgi:hypothetical protein